MGQNLHLTAPWHYLPLPFQYRLSAGTQMATFFVFFLSILVLFIP
ncbi:hypothetical protein OIU77_024364 [Salix suchowensis]|uniref:Uncharacterized protein n=1 Tax=Salix suchowensis TaxID=1278906 RepID=A0ABQ9BSH4_9ROSI|nr:hypothetical protein OIU77_024364 [Salix suchowensis]